MALLCHHKLLGRGLNGENSQTSSGHGDSSLVQQVKDQPREAMLVHLTGILPATGDMEPKPVNPVGTAAFGFVSGFGSGFPSSSLQHSTATTDATSTFSTVSGFGSGFPSSSLQHSTGEASATIIFIRQWCVLGQGLARLKPRQIVTVSSASQSSNAPVNIFATGPHTSSSLLALPSQALNPVFGSGFNNSVASTSLDSSTASSSSSILFKLAAAVKQPPSNSLTFGVFSICGIFSFNRSLIKSDKGVVGSVARKSATVTFKTHEAAELAKKKGKILRPGLPPVVIFWKQQGSRRSTTSESDQPTQLSPDVDKSIDKRHLSPGKTRKVFKQICSQYNQVKMQGEKLQLLEGVDKKLRQAFKRSLDISSAKAVIGTCKDMCPEKERYMRDYQRRLNVFEAVPGTGSINKENQKGNKHAPQGGLESELMTCCLNLNEGDIFEGSY
ncbi:Germinal-center associated nuclear protein [Desmophyllum pertusum]|uniref:Germinal-center associated nuclear protein n=1 Tax=Desmophyllum pertusum TaxID=174260 RepID=A0A9X0CKV2_9CNID|nr:Germinal-center associated nuclear protein [Desmophyllum pertusum]